MRRRRRPAIPPEARSSLLPRDAADVRQRANAGAAAHGPHTLGRTGFGQIARACAPGASPLSLGLGIDDFALMAQAAFHVSAADAL